MTISNRDLPVKISRLWVFFSGADLLEKPFCSFCAERKMDELEIFDSKSLLQIIQHKWNSYGLVNHAFGCIMHFFTVFVILIYVNNAYIAESDDQ